MLYPSPYLIKKNYNTQILKYDQIYKYKKYKNLKKISLCTKKSAPMTVDQKIRPSDIMPSTFWALKS